MAVNRKFVVKHGLDANSISIDNLGAVGSNLAFSGGHAVTFTTTGTTTLTLPTTGTVLTTGSLSTVGNNLTQIATPAATRFLQINSNGTVTLNDAAAQRTAIGAGSGTVTSVSVSAQNNGATLSITNGNTTPGLTIGLGNITPTSVSTGNVTTSTQFFGNQTDTASVPSFSWTGAGNTSTGMYLAGTNVIGFTANATPLLQLSSANGLRPLTHLLMGTNAGGTTAWIRKFGGGYSVTHTPTTPRRVGVFTFVGTSQHTTSTGQLRLKSGGNSAVIDFTIHIRTNATVDSKNISWERTIKQVSGSAIAADMQVYENTANGEVYVTYTCPTEIQSVSWDISNAERGSYNNWVQVETETSQVLTGLTLRAPTSVARSFSLGNWTVDGSITATSFSGTFSTSASAGTIAYSTGSAVAFNTAGTSGYALISGGAGAPTWQEVTSLSTPNTIIARDGSTNFSAGTASLTGSLLVGNAVSTGSANIEIGSNRTGDGNAYIDFWSSATPGDYNLRIIREPGVNGISHITHRGTGNLLISTEAASAVTLRTNGTERMRVDGSGNVNIGTLTTSIARKFTVVGEGNFADVSNNTRLYMGYGTIPVSGGTGAYIYNNDNSPLVFGTNNAERIRIDTAGAIGLVGPNYGTAGSFLMTNGAGVAPAWTTLSLANIPGAFVKLAVRAATTANITLSGTQTIDGIALVAGNRVLVKNQTTASQNGIYVVAAGAWSRAADADTSAEIAGAVVAVDEGSTQKGHLFTTYFGSTDTLGTTSMVWNEIADVDSVQTFSNKTYSNANLTGTVTNNNTVTRSWTTSDTDIDGLINGSTSGTIIEGPNSAHITIGIRSNDLNDGFQVISKGAAVTPATDPYTTLAFEVKANGNTTIGGAATVVSTLNVQGAGTSTFTGQVSVPLIPAVDTSAASKQYVDNVATGLDFKQSVRAATTANITLSGTQTIDGVAVVAGNRVLVKNQTTASQNGIYDVAAGAWTRSADADNSPAGEVTGGMFTFVEEGTANANTGWVLTANNPITLGTTALTFAQFSGGLTSVTLTGDVTGTGTSSIATTLATVNSNVGSFGSASDVATFTVNGKGLITAAGSTAIAIAGSQITSGTIPSAVLGNSSLFVGTTSIALNRASAAQSLTGITGVSSTGALSLTSTTTNAVTLDSGTTGAVNIGNNANAKTITIGNTTGATSVVVNSGTAGVTFNQVASGVFKVQASAAPTTDMVQFTNAGQAVTTAGVNAVNITYVGGAAAVEASAARIDITPGTTTGGTWSALRVVPSAAAATGVTQNGIKFQGITAGAGTDNMIEAGTGWDSILRYNGTTTIINGSGQVIAAQVTGTVGSATTATNLASGAAGQVPYQTGAGATAFVTNAAGVLQAATSGATPAWTTTPSLSGTNFTSLPAGQLTGTVPNAAISGSYTNLTNITGTGTADFSKFLGNAADSAAAPSFSWTGDTDTGMYTPTANQVAISTGNSQSALFTSTRVTIPPLLVANNGVSMGSATHPVYEIALDFGSDVANTWRKIVGASLQNAQYSTHGFIIDIEDPGSNHATTASIAAIKTERYYVAMVRSESTTLDSPDACYVVGPSNRIRAIKTAVGVYEIQIQNEGQFREYRIRISTYASNGTHTITYFDGVAGGTATGTYNASVGTASDVFQQVRVVSTTGSTSTSTGALTVAGGVGVLENLRVGGNIHGNGANITNLNASNLTTGTVPNAAISGAYSGITNLTATGTATFATYRATQGTPVNDSAVVGYSFGADGDTGLFSPIVGGGNSNGVVSLFSNATEILRGTSTGITTNVSITTAGTITINGGALGGTAGNITNLQALTGTVTNGVALETFLLRGATGTDWTTASTRTQQKVDSTWMAWQEYNGSGNNGGIAWGTGSSSVSVTSIPERMRLDSSGRLQLFANIASSTTGSGTIVVTGGVGVSGQVTATTFSGSGSALTSLNASNLSSGIVPNAVISGAYSGITTLDTTGAITSRPAATQDAVSIVGRAGGTGTFGVTITPTNLTASRTLTLPDASGTVALTTQIPTVNNGTLSLGVSGTGISGSASFTANQAGASTFTVTLDSSSAFGAGNGNKVVLRDANGHLVESATIDGGVKVGYRSIPRVAGSTLAATSVGKCHAVTAGVTVNINVFAAGDAVTIYNDSAAAITITQGTSFTLRLAGSTTTGNRTLAARGICTLWFNSATEAVASGAGLT